MLLNFAGYMQRKHLYNLNTNGLDTAMGFTKMELKFVMEQVTLGNYKVGSGRGEGEGWGGCEWIWRGAGGGRVGSV